MNSHRSKNSLVILPFDIFLSYQISSNVSLLNSATESGCTCMKNQCDNIFSF